MPYSKTRALLVVAAVFLLSALLTACGPQAPAPLATRTPLPTFTPPPSVDQEPIELDAPPVAEEPAPQEPAPQEPAPPAPSDEQGTDETQDPTPLEPAPAEPEPELPTPEPDPQVTVSSVMNVRAGPGTNYNIIGSANAGQTFRVTGRNPENTWWQIDFNGQPGWLFGDLVTEQNTQAVAVASNIPAPPPPTPTPIPQPQPPAPQPPAPEPEPQEPEPQEPEPQEPEPQEPEPPSQGDFPFTVGGEQCDPNAGQTYFQGFVRDSNNNPVNGVCVHIHFYEPRNTKCSGCDGVGDGVWGFSPFGGPAPRGTPVEIFVVACDGPMPDGGQTAQSGFGDLTPQSPKWTRVIEDSEQCTGITFYRR